MHSPCAARTSHDRIGAARVDALWHEAWVRDAAVRFGTARAIARQLHCSKTTVTRALDRYGIEPPPTPRRRRQTIAKRTEAIRLYREGFTTHEIAARLGAVEPMTIWKWVKDAGVNRDRATAIRVSYNSARTARGRRRLGMIHTAVKLQTCEGLGRERIARQLGISQGAVQSMLATPYADALKVFVFGPGGEKRKPYARRMLAQGCDEETVMRTLGVTREHLARWNPSASEMEARARLASASLQGEMAGLLEAWPPARREDFEGRLARRCPALTMREHAICVLLRIGFRSKQIAMHLGISLRTVETHRSNAHRKLGLARSARLNAILAEM